MTVAVGQPEAALLGANEVRVAHSQTKQHLRSLTRPEALALAATILRHPERHEQTLTVDRLLLAIPGCGPQHTRALMRHIGLVGAPRRIGALTDRQRCLLADRLDWPISRLASTRGLPAQAAVAPGRVVSAGRLLAALRPDVSDPFEVARLVLAHDDERQTR